MTEKKIGRGFIASRSCRRTVVRSWVVGHCREVLVFMYECRTLVVSHARASNSSMLYTRVIYPHKQKICCNTLAIISHDGREMLWEPLTNLKYKIKIIVQPFTIVLRPSWDCRNQACHVHATVFRFFDKINYSGTHKKICVAGQSQKCCKTASRQPQNLNTTKDCRAKVVHVQFWLTTARRSQDVVNFVRLSCDERCWAQIFCRVAIGSMRKCVVGSMWPGI